MNFITRFFLIQFIFTLDPVSDLHARRPVGESGIEWLLLRGPKREYLDTFYGLSPESQDQILVLTVVYILSLRCMLGDIRLSVGDPATSSCRGSLPRYRNPFQPTNLESINRVRATADLYERHPAVKRSIERLLFRGPTREHLQKKTIFFLKTRARFWS